MPRVKFGDIVKEVKVNVDRANNPYEYFVAGEHMDTDTLEIRRRGTFKNFDVGPAFIRAFQPGQILYGSRRTYLKKVAVADFAGITANTTFVLEAKDERLFLQRLLPFLMLSEKFTDFSIKNSKGSTNPYILFSDLAQFEIDVPPIAEQHRLADLLWAYNETKNSYLGLMAATDALVKSQFIEMFGDPITNPMGWPIKPLSELAEIKIGPFGSLLHREDYVCGGHALINPSHIADGLICPDAELTVSAEKYRELAPYHLQIGDIVLGRRGEMGRCAVVNTDGLLCGTGSIIIRPNAKLMPFILQKILSYPSYKKAIEDKSVGVTMMNLNVPIVSRFQMPLLPIERQEQYISLVEQSDKSKFALQQNIERLEMCRNALMQKAFG